MTKPKSTGSKKSGTNQSTDEKSAASEPANVKSGANNTRANKTGARKPRAKRPRANKLTEFEEEFNRWLFFMDDVLEEFMRRVPDEVRRKLDYSAASLDVVEAWLLERYPVATRYETYPVVIDMAARYIGETFRKTLKGRWWVDPKGKILDGVPHVGWFLADNWSECPHSMATTLTDRDPRCSTNRSSASTSR